MDPVSSAHVARHIEGPVMTHKTVAPLALTLVDSLTAGDPRSTAPESGDLPRSRFAASPADQLCLDLAALRIADQPLATTLHQVAELGRRMLPAAVGLSVALLDARHRCTFAVSGPLAAVLDERQYHPDFGPGIAAAVIGSGVDVADTAGDEVFADFCRSARRSGIRWAVSVPVPGVRPVHASVTAYGVDDALPEPHRALLTDLAPHLAATLVNAYSYAAAIQQAHQLQRAMASRAVIEQAKGIIMSRHGCGCDAAFAVLRSASMHSNRKVRDIAQAVVDGAVDGAGSQGAAGTAGAGIESGVR
jgi:hypothetical protein